MAFAYLNYLLLSSSAPQQRIPNTGFLAVAPGRLYRRRTNHYEQFPLVQTRSWVNSKVQTTVR